MSRVATSILDIVRGGGSTIILGSSRTDEKGRALLRTTDVSGGKFSVRVKKDGYENISSDVQPVSSMIIQMKRLR
jgi:hypothetical protein